MKRIAFIGAPNVGKSSLFSRLAGVYAPVGNWSGLTVTVNQAKVPLAGQLVELLDLPGFYGLCGGGEDEKLAQAVFEKADVDLWVLVLNAAQLPRQGALLEDIAEKKLPMLVVLNQIDEAQRLGVQVDGRELERLLGVPVVATSSQACVGVDELQSEISKRLMQPTKIQCGRLPNNWLLQVWRAPILLSDQSSERIDQWLLHPVWGLPIFAIVMASIFQAVFWTGGWLQSELAEMMIWFSETLLQPSLIHAPDWLSSFLVEGVYEGVATLLSFVPLVAIFFLAMALLSESGYLARMAFLADSLMAKFGLEGRSLVLTVMGMGCNVPGVLGARAISNKRIRWVTQLAMPFALCSARFQVFIFIAAALFAPWQAALVIMGLYVLSIAATLLTAWLSQRRMKQIPYEPMLLEMPSYRLPSLRTAWFSVKFEVMGFVQRASWLILLGVVLIWALLHLPYGIEAGSTDSYAAMIAHTLSPIFIPMGMPEVYIIALLFGFVAKEVVLGGLMIVMGLASQLPEMAEVSLTTMVQQNLPIDAALAFMAFVLLYAPCLATLAVMKQEGGWKLVISSVVWSFVLAWIVAVLIYQLAHRLISWI